MSRDEDNHAISKQVVCSLRKSVVGQTKPLWVRTWRSVHLGWLVTLGVSSVVLAATIVTVGLLETTNADTILSLLWLTSLMFLPHTLALMLSGVGSARLSRFVRPMNVAGVGRGLAVPGRGSVLYRSALLALTLLLGATYVRWGSEAPAHPARHQLEMHVMSHFGAPIFLLFFALSVLIVNRTRISLHPDGIVEEIHRRRGWKVTTAVAVVPWDAIVELQPQTHPNPAVSHPHWYPTIRVVYRAADSESDQVLVLMACEKKVEPNALLSVLTWCRDNPWAREQLAHDDARELLRPPRFLDRIEADRVASMSGRRGVQ